MEDFSNFWPAIAVAMSVAAALAVAYRLFGKPSRLVSNGQFRYQLVMLALTVLGLVAILLALPIDREFKLQILRLIGVIASAAIALASTTLLGNALAGIMIRVVRSFKMGDFIRIGEHFGRVSERGLFHTEIQNEFRELTTLPNLYLVTNPSTTIRRSGTIITASVSLGYEVDRTTVEGCLLEAAARCHLRDPFVQIKNLGDFAITYQIAGLLSDVKLMVSKRSDLRGATLDLLHDAGIEIVSPVFHNQREVSKHRFVPARRDDRVVTARPVRPERILFDKADVAASIEAIEQARDELDQRIEELTEQSHYDAGVTATLHRCQQQRDRLETALLERKAQVEQDS